MDERTYFNFKINTMEIDLFNQPEPSGEELRDRGIQQAIDTAEKMCDNWAEKAYNLFLLYIKTNKKFMAEEFRAHSEGKIPNPPSKRAYGGIMVRAKKAGLIKVIGFKSVTNPKAHKANAAEWEVI